MNTKNLPICILQVSDLHVLPKTDDTLLGIETEYYFKKVLASAYERYGEFDLILATGDLAQQPCVSSYQRIHKIFSHYQTKTVCFPGNHDDYSLMSWLLNKDLVCCDKQTLLGDWQIICLNSQKPNEPGGNLAAQEINFLKRALKSNKKPYIMVSVHHHCLPCESEWLDTMLIENSVEFFECLTAYPNVKLVVTGHVHQTIETQQQGIDVLTTPSTCFQFKPKCRNFTLDSINPGYRIIQLFPDGTFKTQVHRLPGKQDELENHQNGYR